MLSQQQRTASPLTQQNAGAHEATKIFVMRNALKKTCGTKRHFLLEDAIGPTSYRRGGAGQGELKTLISPSTP